MKQLPKRSGSLWIVKHSYKFIWYCWIVVLSSCCSSLSIGFHHFGLYLKVLPHHVKTAQNGCQLPDQSEFWIGRLIFILIFTCIHVSTMLWVGSWFICWIVRLLWNVWFIFPDPSALRLIWGACNTFFKSFFRIEACAEEDFELHKSLSLPLPPFPLSLSLSSSSKREKILLWNYNIVVIAALPCFLSWHGLRHVALLIGFGRSP